MNTATLLADPATIQLVLIHPSLNVITIVVKTKAAQAACPCREKQ